MSTASPVGLRLLALLIAAIAAVGDDGLTHLHLYIHETVVVAGANTSTASSLMFGSMGAMDDELREGPDPASQYLGRAQGMLVQADLANPAASCTIVVLAFSEGDYGSSTLVVDGRVDLGAAVVERGVVGGTGRFRRARGYSLMTRFVGNPTLSTVVFEMDLYFKIGG